MTEWIACVPAESYDAPNAKLLRTEQPVHSRDLDARLLRNKGAIVPHQMLTCSFKTVVAAVRLLSRGIESPRYLLRLSCTSLFCTSETQNQDKVTQDKSNCCWIYRYCLLWWLCVCGVAGSSSCCLLWPLLALLSLVARLSAATSKNRRFSPQNRRFLSVTKGGAKRVFPRSRACQLQKK